MWLQAARRDPKGISGKSTLFVCEDHFNLEDDMENFMEWKIMGVKKRMKKDVVPHKFAWQEDKKRTLDRPLSDVVLKRTKLEITQDAVRGSPSTSTTVPCEEGILTEQLEQMIEEKPSSSCTSVGVQVKLKSKYRSKSSQCNIPTATISRSCSPIKQSTASVALSPMQFEAVKKNVSCTSSESSESQEISELETNETISSSGSEFQKVIENEDHRQYIAKHTAYKIQNHPRQYLGIMKETSFTIDLIKEFTHLHITSIYLTLQKIRLDKTFAELGDDFGVSESTASRIFSKSVGPISEILRDLIIWMPAENVKKCLPIPFRAHFSKVYAIIDCLEIEVQKPEDPIKQALTWSEYKKANTIKYLVSSTPDGVINYISNGFGGRTSDTVIVERSGFLEKLQPNMHIMADRGFKHIDRMLAKKQCVLVRPPSTESGQKLSKAEVLQTKRIASLRIHIERVIRRLREFKMLRPHACINISLIPYLDSIINIAGGLVNTQGPLISGK